MALTVNIDAGEVQYCDPPILVTADHDITIDTVELGLGSFTVPPSTWVASSDPAALVSRPTGQSVQGTLLIGDTIRPASGDYWLYLRLTDTPESLIERSDYKRVRVTNTGSITYP